MPPWLHPPDPSAPCVCCHARSEWRKVREEMNKVWKKVFEQNYHRSLDHRSFYFKQADKKGLLPKTMLQVPTSVSVPAAGGSMPQ